MKGNTFMGCKSGILISLLTDKEKGLSFKRRCVVDKVNVPKKKIRSHHNCLLGKIEEKHGSVPIHLHIFYPSL